MGARLKKVVEYFRRSRVKLPDSKPDSARRAVVFGLLSLPASSLLSACTESNPAYSSDGSSRDFPSDRKISDARKPDARRRDAGTLKKDGALADSRADFKRDSVTYKDGEQPDARLDGLLDKGPDSSVLKSDVGLPKPDTTKPKPDTKNPDQKISDKSVPKPDLKPKPDSKPKPDQYKPDMKPTPDLKKPDSKPKPDQYKPDQYKPDMKPTPDLKKPDSKPPTPDQCLVDKLVQKDACVPGCSLSGFDGGVSKVVLFTKNVPVKIEDLTFVIIKFVNLGNAVVLSITDKCGVE